MFKWSQFLSFPFLKWEEYLASNIWISEFSEQWEVDLTWLQGLKLRPSVSGIDVRAFGTRPTSSASQPGQCFGHSWPAVLGEVVIINPPLNCCGSLLAEIQDSEAISRKQGFIVPAQTQQTHVQRLSPENKGVSLYIPLQGGYRSKKQDLIHIWLYLILLATLS
jgi:hypothetical protein